MFIFILTNDSLGDAPSGASATRMSLTPVAFPVVAAVRTNWGTLDARLLATATLTAVPHGEPVRWAASHSCCNWRGNPHRLWRLPLGEDRTAEAPTSL
ncbi:MAG: hypothetical protein V7L25_00020 [Nostoc sp.]|uniref:hypothetical protein n=1 Tax=Nostoc sp. TaxID=1180 RepID=UPI002FF2F9E3